MVFGSNRGRSIKGRKGNKGRKRARVRRGLQLEILEDRRLMHGDPLAHAADPNHDAPAAVASVSPTAVLPDLIPWVDEAKGFLYGWTVRGQELRLTTAMANVGVGALEIRGGDIIGENIQEVYQRVYEPDGSYNDRLAGTFTYHPEHKHIHFDGFAEFNLREVLPDGGPGALVAGGLKTSFCIIDIENYDSNLPAKYLTCKQVQGLSPGWADLYDSGLPGQQIDITNIQNGQYWLEMVVDPDDHIVEADETNNLARILIDLDRSGAPTDADTFEPNDSLADASILAPPEDHLYEDLSIHASKNSDYFRVTASATGKLSVSIDFQNSQGDLELAIYNGAQEKLVASRTAKDTEKVTVDAEAGDIFYIRVYGDGNATNPNYSMFVDQAEADDADSGDQFEDNDTLATAAELAAVDQVYGNLSILRPSDDDYYSIVPTETGALQINLAFQDAQGNLDLEIYNAAGTRIANSATTGNGEQLKVLVTAGESYYVRVFGRNSATNSAYSMSVDLIEAGESTTYYLSTTAGGSLTSTDGSVSLAFADSDIVRLIAFGTGQYHYEMHFDGSDVELNTASEDIDAFTFRSDGSILISTVGTYSVTGAGGVTLAGGGEDILHFVPTGLGDTTSGAWSLYFDGSDVDLTTSGENIDALAELSDGRLLVSTSGAIKTSGGNGADEDIFAFSPTSLGETTSGTWSLYFDGNDVGLTANDAEDVNGIFVEETGGLPILYLSTVGSFSVSGAKGTNDDIVAFRPTSLGANTAGSFGPGLALDGSDHGLNSFDVDGLQLEVSSSPVTAAARSAALESVFAAQLTAAPEDDAPAPKAKKVTAKKLVHNAPASDHAWINSSQKAKSKTKSTEADCGCNSHGSEPERAKGKPSKKGGRKGR